MTTTETVSISLNRALAAQLRDAAAAKRQTLASVAAEAIRNHLQPDPKTAAGLGEHIENLLSLTAGIFNRQDEIIAAIAQAGERDLKRFQAINDNIKALSSAMLVGDKNADRA